jgi:hypothetical protein
MQPDNIPQNFRRRDNRETRMVGLEPSFDTGVPSPALGLAGVSAEPSHSAKNFPFIINIMKSLDIRSKKRAIIKVNHAGNLGVKSLDPFGRGSKH